MKNNSSNHFIKAFETELKTIENKVSLIQNEIIQIKAFTTSEAPVLKSTKMFTLYDNKTNSVFDLSFLGFRKHFNKFFTEYLNNNKTSEVNETSQKAVEFAEYYKWLNELKVPKTREKFSDLNNEQKLLALHYLFPSLRDYTQNQLANVLSQILNIGPENIRKNLSALYKKDSEIRTIENYEKLIELFENKTFETITNKLNWEINQMS
ncbi:hypothetical protein V8G69_02680 [Gaetbulibacter sp. M235]|uniref:hypothetical protein n=1 Tax=Gaetbulibacter sp. M235 TaxID=3126510 RepID=UPI00374FCCA1